MAFFDEMDRKLSQFGQSVSNKSREVSEGMRLSSAIKAEEEKQNNLYREVGKYYFENCAANAEGQLKVLCDQIVASMELTSQYKQQQNVLKGMVSCPNCGAQISANSGFCNVCGSKIEKQVSPAPQPGAGKICPKCQKTVEADALFCTFCGNQFEAQPAAPAYEEPAAPAYEEPATPAYEEPAAPVYEEPAAPDAPLVQGLALELDGGHRIGVEHPPHLADRHLLQDHHPGHLDAASGGTGAAADKHQRHQNGL